MAEYTNLKCPVCGDAFAENDDIVVCPICGTPHHRECYAKNGKCANIAWHAENKIYNAQEEQEKIEDQKREEEMEKRRAEQEAAPEITCPRCSHKNSPQAIFCSSCGAPISQGFGPKDDENDNSGFKRIVINPFISYKDRNEEIDGIPVWKFAEVVNENSGPVIAKFNYFAKTGRKISFNIFAFLISPFYFLYRKMYGIGIAAFILNLLLSIPDIILNCSNEVLSSVLETNVSFGLTLSATQMAWLTSASYMAMLVSWVINVLCGLFANWLYFQKCKKICAEIDKKVSSQDEFVALANKKGGVNRKLVITLAIVFGAICFIIAWVGTIFMMNPEIFGL